MWLFPLVERGLSAFDVRLILLLYSRRTGARTALVVAKGGGGAFDAPQDGVPTGSMGCTRRSPLATDIGALLDALVPSVCS